MGRGKHCTAERRDLIKKLISAGKTYIEVQNILWSDESKIVLFGGRGSRQFVRRPPLNAFSPKYTLKTVKHSGSSIMIWACFSYYGVGPIYWVKTIMDRYVYVNILNDVMLPYASEDMPLIWTLKQDNDPKLPANMLGSGSQPTK